MLPVMAAPPPLPTGTLTLLFTDIEGSTRLVQSIGAERYATLLDTHRRLLRAAFGAHGGIEVDTQGDAFFVVFPRAVAAAAAAIDAQRAIAAHPWPADAVVRVRMGLHSGDVVRAAEGYVGVALNQGARVCAVAHGGQIFASSACHVLLTTSEAPAEWALRDLGEHRLRDIRHTERLYQVLAPGMPDVATPPAGRAHPRDRILVRPSADPRTLPEALRALLAVVRSEDRSATLSPADLQAVVTHPVADMTTYWLGRVAEWSQPRFHVDDRFVDLTLLVDQGEESTAGRWKAREERFTDLGALLDRTPDRALVLLGAPGSGKSTLLRRFELDTAIAALQSPPPARRERDRRGPSPRQGEGAQGPLTFFVSLNQYHPSRPGAPPPAPREWLAERWSARYPGLPALADLLASVPIVFLLDALNEAPHTTYAEYRAVVGLWKQFVIDTARDHPASRVLFSCRSLDYSAPLSTPELRVPQVVVEPLSDRQVEAFLRVHSPAQAAAIWARLQAAPQLAAVRTPYFLRLLVDEVEATGRMPAGPAGLFTGFVRQALRREVERENPRFRPDGAAAPLLTDRDLRRVAHGAGWRTAWELPERGALIPKLEALAYGMQVRAGTGATSQVRVDLDTAIELIAHERGEDIVKAGLDLAVLDEDVGWEEVQYFHQLLQEYFAARWLTDEPSPGRVRQEWRAGHTEPPLQEALASLAPADELPPLPTTGWEETAVMAAAMAVDPEAFIRGIMAANLALAGRCADQPEARERLGEPFLDELRWALVRRCGDGEADLRHRIACGLALGPLGDPRFERRVGPHGAYLLPPLVAIPSGSFPIGDGEAISWPDGATDTAHMPRHAVALAPFAIGRFAVTNAEYACFIEAGGYEDERWWGTPEARAWRRGEDITAEGYKHDWRDWRRRFLRDRDALAEMERTGRLSPAQAAAWRDYVGMDDAAFETALAAQFPARRITAPRWWHGAWQRHPARPVIGISWFEAHAYCAWLSAQAGGAYRLPSEAEWEAAARGPVGRRYAYGDAFDPTRGNTFATHVCRTTPVGVFATGLTPEGTADLTGNTFEWTHSQYGPSRGDPAFRYPYDPRDGRENPDSPPGVLRVARGGSWVDGAEHARAAFRYAVHPALQHATVGLRVACDDGGGG